MLRVSLNVAGEQQLDRALSRWGDEVKDMSPAFKAMAKDFREIMEKQFSSEGGYSGAGWAPLTETWAAWKAANYGSLPILQLTGILKDSLTGQNPYAVERITKDNMAVGTQLSYALYHQRGTATMPQRKIIDLTEQDKQRWMKILHNFAFDKAKEARLR